MHTFHDDIINISWYQLRKYTEHQMKLITSSERHSLKSKAPKLTISEHNLAIVLLTKHIKKKSIWLSQEGVKWVKSQEVTLKKSQKMVVSRPPWRSSARTKASIRHWNWMNSYWMIRIGCLSWRFSVSSFCDFGKITFCSFIAFFSFLAKATLWFFRCAS